MGQGQSDSNVLVGYCRCPEIYGEFGLPGRLTGRPGYFRFGPDAVCFGRLASGNCAADVTGELYDAMQDVRLGPSSCSLPFDPGSLVDNLRCERYLEYSS